MAVHVDFEEHRDFRLMLPAEVRNGFRGFRAVEDDLQINAQRPDPRDLCELLRRYADGVDQVADAVRGKVARFRKRGNGGGAFGRRHLPPGNHDRLVGLEVRTESDAELTGAGSRAFKVLFELFVLNQEGRRRDARVIDGEPDQRLSRVGREFAEGFGRNDGKSVAGDHCGRLLLRCIKNSITRQVSASMNAWFSC